jgi:hypothetical protein
VQTSVPLLLRRALGSRASAPGSLLGDGVLGARAVTRAEHEVTGLETRYGSADCLDTPRHIKTGNTILPFQQARREAHCEGRAANAIKQSPMLRAAAPTLTVTS